VDDPEIFSSLDSLSLRRTVGSLSLFYRFFNGRCSHELADCLPTLMPPIVGRVTRGSVSRHPYTVSIPTSRISRHQDSFLPTVSRLWNSLPPHVFPPLPTYNLPLFKRNISKFFRALPPTSDIGWGYLVW
jgi:hypothetical protein